MRWRHGSSRYEITVENPGRRNRGVAEAVLDGARVEPQAIPLVDDGALHRLRVVMGEPAPGGVMPPVGAIAGSGGPTEGSGATAG